MHPGLTKPDAVGDFFTQVSWKSSYIFPSKVLVALSVYFFTNNHTYYLFFNIQVKRAPVFLKFDLYKI
jgi:hypothetical protein